MLFTVPLHPSTQPKTRTLLRSVLCKSPPGVFKTLPATYRKPAAPYPSKRPHVRTHVHARIERASPTEGLVTVPLCTIVTILKAKQSILFPRTKYGPKTISKPAAPAFGGEEGWKEREGERAVRECGGGPSMPFSVLCVGHLVVF